MFNGLVSMAKWADGPITPRAHLLIGPFGHRNKSIKHRTTAIGQLTFGGRSQVCPAVRSLTAPTVGSVGHRQRFLSFATETNAPWRPSRPSGPQVRSAS